MAIRGVLDAVIEPGTKYEPIAYVRGSEEDRQCQKDAIQKSFLSLREEDCVLHWRAVERRLAGTEQDRKFMLVVTDLQVLSKKPKEWAERMIFLAKTGALLRPLKYEHVQWLRMNCGGGPETPMKLDGEKSNLQFLENLYRGLIEEDAKREQTINETTTQEADKPAETKKGKRPQKTKQSGKPKRIKRRAGKTKEPGNKKGKSTTTGKTKQKRKPKR